MESGRVHISFTWQLKDPQKLHYDILCPGIIRTKIKCTQINRQDILNITLKIYKDSSVKIATAVWPRFTAYSMHNLYEFLSFLRRWQAKILSWDKTFILIISVNFYGRCQAGDRHNVLMSFILFLCFVTFFSVTKLECTCTHTMT